MPLIDAFVRGGGESAPFLLSNHTPDAGGTWGSDAAQFVISPDGFVRHNRASTTAPDVALWSGDVGSANYEVGVTGSFRSTAANQCLAACVRTSGPASGVLCRIYTTSTANAGVVNINDAANTGSSFNVTLNFTYVTGRSYLVVGSASGTAFTCSVKDLTTSQWLNSAGSFSSATRIAAITVTSSAYTAKAFAGIQDFAAASDTAGAAYEKIEYGAVGSIGAPPPAAATLTGPTTGTAGSPSASFTVGTDNSIQAGTVIVTPSDGGGGGTFAPASITLSGSAGTGVFAYTAATAGTYSISTTNNASLSNPPPISFVASAPVAVTAYTLTGPSACVVGVASSAFTVTLGAGTLSGTAAITPSSSGGGGTFTPATVSLTNSSRSATFTYTAASAGAKTISTTNNASLSNPPNLSATASVDQTFYCDNANIVKSPTNWAMTGAAGSMSAETVWPGSYMRLRFNGTAISINVSTTGLSAYPWVFYQIDNLDPVVARLTPGQTVISVSPLSAGDHELTIIYQAKDNIATAGSWASSQQLKIVSFSPAGGTGVIVAPTARTRRAVIFGDSITEGANIGIGSPTVAAAGLYSAATAAYSHHVGTGLNAEFDQCGMSGNGWSAAGYGDFPNFINSWNLVKSGVTRAFAGYDYILVNHGRNDTSGIASSVVTDWLAAVRAVSQAHVFLLIPFAGGNRNAITTGVANYIAANPSESRIYVIDLGSTFYQSVATGYYTLEGVHALPWNGGRLAAAYLGGIAGKLGTGTTAAPTYRGGFRRL